MYFRWPKSNKKKHKHWKMLQAKTKLDFCYPPLTTKSSSPPLIHPSILDFIRNIHVLTNDVKTTTTTKITTCTSMHSYIGRHPTVAYKKRPIVQNFRLFKIRLPACLPARCCNPLFYVHVNFYCLLRRQ